VAHKNQFKVQQSSVYQTRVYMLVGPLPRRVVITPRA
jgi:hypothetical protein